MKIIQETWSHDSLVSDFGNQNHLGMHKYSPNSFETIQTNEQCLEASMTSRLSPIVL